MQAAVESAAISPTFTPAAGTYSTAQTVSVASATSGATIYYTLDGSVPTSASKTYTAPMTVGATETIQAMAAKAGMEASAAASATYTIVPIPTLPAGTQCEFLYAGGSGSTWPATVGSYTTTLAAGSQAPVWATGGLTFNYANHTYADVDTGCLNGAQTVMVFYTPDVQGNIANNDQLGVVLGNKDFTGSNVIHYQPAYPNVGPGFGSTNFASEDRVTGTVAATFTFGAASGSNKVYVYDKVPVSQYVQTAANVPYWSSSGGPDTLSSSLGNGYFGFGGVIHAVASWPRALSQAEIQTAYRSISAALAPYGVVAQDTTNYASRVVLATGDSITECLIDAFAYNGCIMNQAMDSLNTGLPYYNVGQSGFSTITLSQTFPTQIAPIVALYTGGNPVVILASGSNDIKSGFLNTDILADYAGYCAQVVALHGTCGLSTVLPRGDYTAAQETQRKALNAAILSGVVDGSLNAIAFADWGGDPIMGNPGTTSNATYYNNDFIHPLAAGSTVLSHHHALAMHRMLSPATAYTVKITLDPAAFQGLNATTASLKLLQLMPAETVCGVSVQVGTALSGTGISGLTATVGNASVPGSSYGSAVSLLAAGDSTYGAVAGTSGGVVQANLTAVGANLSAVAAGSVDFNICVISH